MLGAIPNPKKSTIVNFPISRLTESLNNIHLLSKKYKIEKSNPSFHQYTFSASEFLSLGVYIDVDLNMIDENRTEIVIEVKRKLGAFDQSHEVQLANQHLENMFDFLGKLTSGNIEQIREDKQKSDAKAIIDGKWYNSSLWMFLAALLFWPIGVYGLIKTNRSIIFKAIFGIMCLIYAYFWIKALSK